MVEFNKFAVGRVVRQLRKSRGLSQEVFSGLVGIARSHLAMIESGSKQANFETVWRIANAFDMAPHTLVRLVEEEIQRGERTKQK
ncbi:MAG: helix-turn-helix domain-containing protein [Acutalibacter sp.]